MTYRMADSCQKQYFPLTPEGIDQASEALTQTLDAFQLDRKDALRLRLSVEDILLKWMDSGGLKDRFELEVIRRFHRINISLRCAGEAVDPMKQEDVLGGEELGRSMLEALGLSPTWRYRNGVNVVFASLKLPQKLGALTQVLIAAASAVVLGLLCKQLSVSAQTLLLKSLVEPVFNGFLGALSCIVGPMMFLSMVWSIFNLGDARQLGRIGRKLLLRFFVVLVIVVTFAIGASLLVFRVPFSGGQGGESILRSIVEMLMDIIPSNIVEPFLNGNTLQILFMGVVVGVTMILLRDRMQTLSQIVEQSNAIVQAILSAIGSMVPAFIFLSVLRLILDGNTAASAVELLKVVLLCIAVSVVEMAAECLSMLRLGISPVAALKKMSTHTLIGLSTASSSATFSAMFQCCEEKLGIEPKLASFALPFGNVIFKPSVAHTLAIVSLFMASFYNIEISARSLLMCLINSVILSCAAPPIPGGLLTCYSLMFMALDIPLEALSLAAAANALLDFPMTAGNTFSLTTHLAHSADRMDMLNKKILKSK